MWWLQYVLLFGGGVLCALGAFSGRARGFASLLGTFVWFVIGNASVAVVYYDGSGAEHVAQSVALAWLCYGLAAIHFVVLLITLHEILTSEDTLDDMDDLATAVDPAATEETPDFDALEQ